MNQIIFWFLTVFFIFVGQMLSTDFLSIFGVFPNLLLLSTIFFALQSGSNAGQWVGFFLGLLADVASISILGSQAFMFTLIGHFVGRLHGQIDEEKPMAQMAIVLAMSILYFLGLLFFENFFTGTAGRFWAKATIFQPLYTTLASPVYFWLLTRWCFMGRLLNTRDSDF